MPMLEILKKHGLTQRDMAEGTGLAVSAVCDIVNGKRQPTTGTVHRVLAYVRQFEPGIAFEDLFEPEPLDCPVATVAPGPEAA